MKFEILRFYFQWSWYKFFAYPFSSVFDGSKISLILQKIRASSAFLYLVLFNKNTCQVLLFQNSSLAWQWCCFAESPQCLRGRFNKIMVLTKKCFNIFLPI
jgi:hypothetical protein